MYKFWTISIIFLACLLPNMYGNEHEPLHFEQVEIPTTMRTRSTSCFVEDELGFLYIAASSLLRYDGNTTEEVKTISPNGKRLRMGIIHAMQRDSDGNVWMASENGVYIFNSQTRITRVFEAINLRGVPCRAIIETREHEIAIGSDRGLHIYDPKNEKLVSYYSQTANNQPALSHDLIRTIYEDTHGVLWVGTHDKFNRLDREHNMNTIVDLRESDFISNNLVLSVHPCHASDSILWVGTETGLCEFNTRTLAFNVISNANSRTPFSNNVIKTISVIDSSQVWLGTDYGLNIYNPISRTVRSYFHDVENVFSINHNVVTKIYKDRQGNAWLATNNGLNKIAYNNSSVRLNKFNFHTPSLGQINNIYSFAKRKNNEIWIGCIEGLINYDLTTGKKEHFLPPVITHNKVHHLLVDNKNRLWFATPRGLNRYNPKQGNFSKFVSDNYNPHALQTNYLTALELDAYGNIWIGSYDSGLQQLIENEKGEVIFRNYKHQANKRNSLSSNNISQLVADQFGNVWVGSYGGLDVIHSITNNVERICSKEISSVSTFCIFENILWIVSENKLIKYDIKNRVLVEKIDFMPETKSMIAHDGDLWFSTDKYIYKYATDECEFKKVLIPKNCVGYFINDAVYADDQSAYFAGYSGFISFDFDAVKFEDVKSTIYFTNLRILDETIEPRCAYEENVILSSDIDYADSIVLKHTQNDITLELTNLDYVNASSAKFAYQLSGYDKDWRYTDNDEHTIRYVKLPFGDYELNVKLVDVQGEFLSDGRTLFIQIMPPFWLTNWAICVYVILSLLVIGFAINVLNIRSKERSELQTQRIQREKTEELIEIKSRFFTNISHELRTPLTLVINPVKRLIDREEDVQKQETLHLIERNAERVLKLVNQVLDMRKIERGHEKLQVQQSNIVEFCKVILDRLFEEALHRDISLNFQYDKPLVNLWFDAEKIEKVLSNLLSNAFKFTPDGGAITLEISTTPTDVQISVTDTGCGIDEAYQNEVFDRFTSVQSTNYTSQEGSGIGLSIVKDYVNMHQGEISLESTLGKGSRFVISLPIDKDSLGEYHEVDVATIADEQANHDLKSATHRNKPLLLLVEDDNDMLIFVKEIFSDYFIVVSATDGEEGLAKIEKYAPDIVVSDVMMPRMTGIELCQKIKQDIKTCHIPVVLLTAKNRQDDIIHGVEAGADDYISKPFNIEHLLLRTRKIIELRSTLRKKFVLDSDFPSNEEQTIESLDDKFLYQLLNIVNENLSNPDFSVQILCEIMEMNNNTLYNKVKTLTGLSIVELLKQQRLKKAAKLFEGNKYNVSEVMYMVGFTHNSYFSRAFKAKYGLSPKDYQRSKQTKEDSVENDTNLP